MKSFEEINVIGSGYVGLVSAACFANMGYRVHVIDKDQSKIDSLLDSKIPFYEPGLKELVNDGIESESLLFYTDYSKLIKSSKAPLTFLCVGTPVKPSGECNLDYVKQAVIDLGRCVGDDHLIVLKSTIPPGTCHEVKELLNKEFPDKKLRFANNPEFLREGAAVNDFLKPERIVIGVSDEYSADLLKSLYSSLVNNGHPLFVCSHETAEISKLASNLMLASRISVINQVANLSEAYEADIKKIQAVMRTDSRIGSRYLYAGIGYGGSCFPKDVAMFRAACQKKSVNGEMADAVNSYNVDQKLLFMSDILKNFEQPEGKTVCLLGTSFKPQTDDIREGPALDITRKLLEKGFKIQSYDPKANANYERWTRENCENADKLLKVCDSKEEAMNGADLLIVCTEWQEFQNISPVKLKKHFKGKYIYDGRNILSPKLLQKEGYRYMGVSNYQSI